MGFRISVLAGLGLACVGSPLRAQTAIAGAKELQARCEGKLHPEKAPGSIDAICKNSRKISKVRTLDELDASVCSAALEQGDSLKRADLALDVLKKSESLRLAKSESPLAD